MHWKLKAKIQNFISFLPSSVSYSTYYWIQRHFGGLRRMNPSSRVIDGIATWRRIKELGSDPKGKVFLEIGTGRVPVVPLTFWLMGAKTTITIDLNPYLRKELISETLQYISDNEDNIRKIFGLLLDNGKLDDLLLFHNNISYSTDDLLDFCNIKYIAPGDATKTGLPAQSIDFITSYNVFEHIPPAELDNIIKEGNRIIHDNGLFIHKIDYSDHFSHTDKRISPINFLQYSDAEWNKYAGNRYMYMNRLRHDDFISMFRSAGHRILATDIIINQLPELLRRRDLQLNVQFKTKSDEVLSILGAWIVTQKSA